MRTTVLVLLTAPIFSLGLLQTAFAADMRVKAPIHKAPMAPPAYNWSGWFAFGLFGFFGLLIAVPAAAAIGVLMRFALRTYYASPFYTPASTAPSSGEIGISSE
jgi:hypothetical protein